MSARSRIRRAQLAGMDTEAIDVFCHVLPPVYCAAVRRVCAPPFMFERAAHIDTMSNVDARARKLDAFPGYRQIVSLGSPPVEALTAPPNAADLARTANDAMADWVSRDRGRYAGFVGAVPLNDMDAAVAEARRACLELGALGVQLFTSIGGKPIDSEDTLALIGEVAGMGRAIWLHPIRPMSRADYDDEPYSKFDLWWALGWPYETGLAMARLVFAGVFDRYPDLVIVTHHAGGVVPMLEGRLAAGLDQLGTRTPPGLESATSTALRERPIDAFRRFHADTASFGSKGTIACGLEFFGHSRVMFASDMPFGPEGGAALLRDTLAAVHALDIPPETRRAVLAGNAARIFRIGDSA